MIGTYRDSDLTRGHPLSELLADLRREEGVERIALSGLEQDDVVELMEAAAGPRAGRDRARRWRREVARETDGNPFFVAEILRHLVESGAHLPAGERALGAVRGPCPTSGCPTACAR